MYSSKMNQESSNENEDDVTSERNISFEIPIITTSSPSSVRGSDSISSPIYVNVVKHLSARSIHSDEETDTSFSTVINNNNNNNTQNGHVSVLRSLSPANLNASNASRGNVRRWSQSLTSASKGRPKRTINILPSRLQKLPAALSLDGQVNRIVDNEFQFEQFVHEIEQYDYLMEHSATANQTRNKILRALPQCLYIKRQIKAKIDDIVKEKSQRMRTNRWKRGLHFFGLCKTKTQRFVHNSMRYLQLWNDSMKEIEGHFGAAAETYFRLFRFLFIINLILMCITFMFIILPQLISDYFKNNVTNVTRTYVIDVEQFEDNLNFFDLFTGQGSFENSTLFYGAYTNQRIEIWSTTYSLPFAYLTTMVCFYAITFIVFSITTAESYRRSFIATSGGQSLRAHKLFCSWDFGISNQQSANMKHQSIYLELKSIVNQLYENVSFQTVLQRICGYAISTVIWIFVIVVLIIITSTILFTAEMLEQIDVNGQLAAFFRSVPSIGPIIIVFSLFLCQYLFDFLGFLETRIVRIYRSPRSQLHIALVRNYLLNIVMITSMACFWLSNTEQKHCWETWIAQSIYRLVTTEFFFITCIGSILRFVRFFIYKYLWRNIGISEFSISRGCIGLIFNQTLLWIGIFFSPPLAAVMVLKMVATFYLKKLVLINCCKPPSKHWRSAQTYTLFLSMLFVSVTIVIVISLYVLTQMNVSKACGPFRNHIYMFHVLRGDILKLQENHFLWQLITFLVRPAAIGLLLLTLCVLVYYLRSKSKSRIEMVKLLKQMLYIEAKDKAFLLANITRVTHNNEWLLDDCCVKQPFLRPPNRTIDKYTDRPLANRPLANSSHRKFSQPNFGDSTGASRSRKNGILTHHFASSERITNGTNNNAAVESVVTMADHHA